VDVSVMLTKVCLLCGMPPRTTGGGWKGNFGMSQTFCTDCRHHHAAKVDAMVAWIGEVLPRRNFRSLNRPPDAAAVAYRDRILADEIYPIPVVSEGDA
jgi:hypothetical protein